MTVITAKFNSLEYVRKARKLGYTQDQAEFNAHELEQVIETISNNQDIATKHDLLNLELRLVKWVVATGTVTILSIAGLLKLIVH